MPNVSRIRWLRFIYPDGAFHFLHAVDIAKVVVALLSADITQNELALGNAPYSGKKAIAEVCAALGIPVYFQIRVPNTFLMTLARWLKNSIHPWDRFCITHPHFSYSVVNPSDFGLPVSFPTLLDVVKDVKAKWQST